MEVSAPLLFLRMAIFPDDAMLIRSQTDFLQRIPGAEPLAGVGLQVSG